MQFELRQLTALLAISSLFGAANARRNLTEFCSDLSRSMASNDEVYTSAQAALKEASPKLKAWSNVGKSSRPKLARAWEAVINEESCNPRSSHHAAVIATCKPEDHAEMVTLAEAVRKYTNKCLTADFWDKQLKKALAGSFGNPDKTYLTSFMDDRFIRTYREDNQFEEVTRFDNADEEEECCKPSNSHTSIFEALVSKVGVGKVRRAIENWDKDILDTKMEFYLEGYLFVPCNRYLFATHDLMMRAKNVAKYYQDGKLAFIRSLSQNFRDAIFRYRYCLRFLYLDTPLDKLSDIGRYSFELELERQQKKLSPRKKDGHMYK